MKAIISGKKYDTSTAKLMGCWDNGEYPYDAYYIESELYRKRTGEFFLHRWGGALTGFAVNDGTGCYSGSGDIMPLTTQEAQEWAENHLSADEYEEIFGEVEE